MASTLRQRNAPTASSKKERRDSDILSTSSDEDTSPATSHLENTFPPFEVPNYTIKEVLGAIPAECFERSALISSAYVARDFAFVAALGYAASFIEPALGYNGESINGWVGFAAKWAAWALYWTVQGWVMTGIWILGTSPVSSFSEVIHLYSHFCLYRSRMYALFTYRWFRS